ncbi:hypothetical protein EHS25_007276 [Saitozyma podzolica]|uniref:Uncharacterized protein n=1 Tax=Saitozyma podzolica TaxID=1890683 RepID=A0A427XMP0_9TREE|nr:hypothetical protein EHS25_007276 [Saitozyma podzolica]
MTFPNGTSSASTCNKGTAVTSGGYHQTSPSQFDQPYSAAIVYLTGTERTRATDTLTSLEMLARNVPLERPYPILMMHDGGNLADPIYQQAFTDRWTARIEELRQSSESVDVLHRMEALRSMIEFVQVDMAPPEDAMRVGMQALNPFFDSNWPGYHSMCRLFGTRIFTHPRVRDLDFYMRMDTDSFFPEPLAYDPFALAFRHNLSYAARLQGTDGPHAVVGLWDCVAEFLQHHPDLQQRMESNSVSVPPEPRGSHGFPGWYNNFEIVHLPSFQRLVVVSWLRNVEKHWRGFYQHRWGRSHNCARSSANDAAFRRCLYQALDDSNVLRV